VSTARSYCDFHSVGVRCYRHERKTQNQLRSRLRRVDSLECGNLPPQRGCRAGDPGCYRFGNRRPVAAVLYTIAPSRFHYFYSNAEGCDSQ
jgi:hypothetical protein